MQVTVPTPQWQGAACAPRPRSPGQRSCASLRPSTPSTASTPCPRGCEVSFKDSPFKTEPLVAVPSRGLVCALDASLPEVPRRRPSQPCEVPCEVPCEPLTETRTPRSDALPAEAEELLRSLGQLETPNKVCRHGDVYSDPSNSKHSRPIYIIS